MSRQSSGVELSRVVSGAEFICELSSDQFSSVQFRVVTLEVGLSCGMSAAESGLDLGSVVLSVELCLHLLC